MYISQALEGVLLEQDDPVVTDYDIYRIGHRLFEARSFHAAPITRLPEDWSFDRAQNVVRQLRKRTVIAPDADFSGGVWRVVQSARSAEAADIACIADPFCYISHLSAMQRFGITDRSAEALHLTTPARPQWNVLRLAQMKADFGFDPGRITPALHRPKIAGELRRRPVIVHETRHPATPTQIRGERARIAPIGRTFVDMLNEPQLCGGMRHVLDVWERQAETWLDPIVDAVDEAHAQIVKVRAGFILEERLGVTDPRIEAWTRFAQRGGSRKLDAESDYVPVWSEKWMISINV